MKKPKVIFLFGIHIGDESKGGITDYLTQKYRADTIVRYNGGPQASHHVINKQGITHCFSHFGSGSFRKETTTFLSSYMLIKPSNILVEADVLREKIPDYEPLDHIKIDKNCVIVTPMHKLIGRMKETAREIKHGSVGMGVGVAAYDSRHASDEQILRLCDLIDTPKLQKKLQVIYDDSCIQARQIISQYPENTELIAMLNQFEKECTATMLFESYCTLASIFTQHENIVDDTYLSKYIDTSAVIVFEGAQGLLLDYQYGFVPYVTKTNTRLTNANALLQAHKKNVDIQRIGIMRAYATRHGAGPLVTQDDILAKKIPEFHNKANHWQGKYRIGWLDIPMTQYALSLVEDKLNSISVTNLDRFDTFATIKVCTSYEYCSSSLDLVDRFFYWERVKNRIKIIKYKPALLRTSEEQALLTQILFDCKPWDFQVFPGWKQQTSDIKSYKDLPKNAKKYLDFIETSLQIPISIISVGPRTDQKFEKKNAL